MIKINASTKQPITKKSDDDSNVIDSVKPNQQDEQQDKFYSHIKDDDNLIEQRVGDDMENASDDEHEDEAKEMSKEEILHEVDETQKDD